MPENDHRFTNFWDAVDPFDPEYPHLWIKVEHLGRYLFAARYLAGANCGTVLDVGCGRGYGAAELSEVCEQVVAIDDDPKMLEYARMNNDRRNVDYQHAPIGAGGIPRLFGERPVDGAICFETLEHLTGPATAIEELFSTIRPGGVLILSVPNGMNERIADSGLVTNTEHRRVFSISSITELLADGGFTVSEVLGQPLTNTINANETRLIRRKQTDGRIGNEPAFHEPATIRRLALAVGYPEPRDVERSYSIVVVAHRPD